MLKSGEHYITPLVGPSLSLYFRNDGEIGNFISYTRPLLEILHGSAQHTDPTRP